MTPSQHKPYPLRAAVIGASGIGKHHAKWYHRAGCQVVAFCGTSEASTAKTAQALADLFGFQGKAYWDCAEMLAAESPEVVSVCTPPELHHDHVLSALAHGADVMCEKPLVWGDPGDIERLLAQAGEMVAAAQAANRLLAVNTQYVAAAEAYQEFLGRSSEPIESFFMRMESRGAPGGRGYQDIWLDLASHPLSVLMAFVPDGQVDWQTASCELRPDEVIARFDYLSPTTGVCQAQIQVGNIRGDKAVRRFGINDTLVEYEGRNDEQGVFCAYLSGQGCEGKFTDLVETSLTRFVAAARGEQVKLLASGADGLKNLELQLRLLARAPAPSGL